jgi:hypothetical protein
MSHEFSAVTYGGVRKALVELGWYDAVCAAASPGTRAILQAPETAKYHPGSGLDEIVELLEAQHGPTGPQRMLRAVTAKSLEGVVAPLARIFVTLMGNSPAVIFERFETFVKSTSRGVSASWKAASEKSGTLVIRYGSPRTLAVAHGWKGALEHVLDFCKAEGTVEVLPLSTEANSVSFLVRWK